MGGGQFGDTTYTKVFVGGLAWETQKETMKEYFEQFGDILEAVVITDKITGRSKGYGFVTFREAEGAMRACVDATPVIDGRRANCNLASLGVPRSKPSTPKHARNTRVMSTLQTGFATGPTLPHYAIQQHPHPFNLFGYSPYSPDYAYPTSFYSGMISSGPTASPIYPYVQFGDCSGGASSGYGTVRYPHHLFHYPGTYPHQYAAPISLAPSTPLQSGMMVSLQPHLIPHRYRDL